MGALFGGRRGARTDVWLAPLLNVPVGLWLWDTLPRVTSVASVQLGPARLVASGWWVLGLVVASLSVMMGSVGSAIDVPRAVALGGLLTALPFLGPAAGAALFGPVGRRYADTRGRQKGLGLLTLASVPVGAALLTGVLSASASGGLDAVFLLSGIFGNG